MDDPRKGACNFSEDTANFDSNLLYQSQNHKQMKQKLGHVHRLHSGNKASTAHLLFWKYSPIFLFLVLPNLVPFGPFLVQQGCFWGSDQVQKLFWDLPSQQINFGFGSTAISFCF